LAGSAVQLKPAMQRRNVISVIASTKELEHVKIMLRRLSGIAELPAKTTPKRSLTLPYAISMATVWDEVNPAQFNGCGGRRKVAMRLLADFFGSLLRGNAIARETRNGLAWAMVFNPCGLPETGEFGTPVRRDYRLSISPLRG
jgi:hypothetical protein